MNDNKVLITGCGGMLGNAIYPYFTSRYSDVLATDKDVNESWLEYLDVRETDKLKEVIDSFKPDLILHLAAETDLEFCETHPDISEATNATATLNIAKLAEECGATLVYISTAGVFDGLKEGYYTEEDQPKPIMIYGQTKYDGEKYVAENTSKYYIIRAGWMVGGGRKDKKFVNKIIEQVLENKDVIRAVDDKWGTPTYTHDFAMNLFSLLDSKEYGTYHMVCEGYGTRYDVANEILTICGREDITLEPVSSDYFKEEYFVPRPPSEMMENANLRKIGINYMRPWHIALRDYIAKEFEHTVKDETIQELKEYVALAEKNAWKGNNLRRGINRRVCEQDWTGTERRKSSDRRDRVEMPEPAAVAS